MKLLLIFALVATAFADSNLEEVLKASNDQFTANMFQEVVKSHGDESCVLSAFSVLSPLAQLALASVGESHDEILRVIGFPNDNITKEVFADINAKLRSVKGVDLEQANKIYIRKDYSLNDQFAVLSKDIFNSEVGNIDFQDKMKAADEINGWVEDHTNKLIKDLVTPDSIDENTVAMLVNAIYFKGKWANPFEEYSTEDREFHVSKDKTITVRMMYQLDSFRYSESKELDAKFLELHYEGDETSLVLALPNKVDGINELIEEMKNPSALNQMLQDMHYEGVNVYLPKFKIETTTNLLDVLEKMNIKKLFHSDAKLYNLLKDTKDLYISAATQKAFIEVNEEGAQAAAANSFDIVRDMAENVYYFSPKEFNADHPFLFFLIEKNNILFNGVFRS